MIPSLTGGIGAGFHRLGVRPRTAPAGFSARNSPGCSDGGAKKAAKADRTGAWSTCISRDPRYDCFLKRPGCGPMAPVGRTRRVGGQRGPGPGSRTRGGQIRYVRARRSPAQEPAGSPGGGRVRGRRTSESSPAAPGVEGCPGAPVGRLAMADPECHSVGPSAPHPPPVYARLTRSDRPAGERLQARHPALLFLTH